MWYGSSCKHFTAVEVCLMVDVFFEHCFLVKHFIDLKYLSCFLNLDMRGISATCTHSISGNESKRCLNTIRFVS